MSLLRPQIDPQGSPFSEIRQIERDRVLVVVASVTVAATSCLIGGALVALGLAA